MEVMFPGNKVCAVEVVITPDPIKLIKPQLIIMEGCEEEQKKKKKKVVVVVVVPLKASH